MTTFAPSAGLPTFASAAMSESVRVSLAKLPRLPAFLGALDGKRIVASGATGFFGVWLHAALQELDAQGCQVRLARLARSPAAFEAKHPQWSGLPWASWIQADASSFGSAEAGPFDFGLHMAASSDAATNAANPRALVQGAVDGANGMLDLCSRAGARMLFASSGAVYGKKSSAQGPSAEADSRTCAPDPLNPAECYGESKRIAEMLCAVRSREVASVIARPFAFLGPHLPLDAHFAAGNFLRDASRGLPIEISGDGQAIRSYMHPADMIAWTLWLMALGPAGQAVNVGSSEAIDLASLARAIAAKAGSPAPAIRGAPGARVDCYVPDVSAARALGLEPAHSLESSIEQSLAWLAGSPGGGWLA